MKQLGSSRRSERFKLSDRITSQASDQKQSFRTLAFYDPDPRLVAMAPSLPGLTRSSFYSGRRGGEQTGEPRPTDALGEERLGMVRTIFDTRLRDLNTEMKFALCKGRTEPTSVVARSSNSITHGCSRSSNFAALTLFFPHSAG